MEKVKGQQPACQFIVQQEPQINVQVVDLWLQERTSVKVTRYNRVAFKYPPSVGDLTRGHRLKGQADACVYC